MPSRDYLNDEYPEPRGIWPDAATLAAGDEDKLAPAELGDLEDGHLENDAWRKEHPDAER